MSTNNSTSRRTPDPKADRREGYKLAIERRFPGRDSRTVVGKC